MFHIFIFLQSSYVFFADISVNTFLNNDEKKNDGSNL